MEAQPQGEAIIIYQDQSDIVSGPGSTVQTNREACIVSGFRTQLSIITKRMPTVSLSMALKVMFPVSLPVKVMFPMLYFSSPDAVDEVLSRVMTKLVLSVPLYLHRLQNHRLPEQWR